MRFVPLLAASAAGTALVSESVENDEFYADPSEALSAFHSQYRQMKEKAEHRSKHMRPDEALALLKSKLPLDDHAHLSMLAVQARDNSTLNVQEMAKGNCFLYFNFIIGGKMLVEPWRSSYFCCSKYESCNLCQQQDELITLDFLSRRTFH